MLPWSRAVTVVIACAVLPTISIFGCQPDLPGTGALCGEIPGGGCPSDRGGSCQDPSCTGVYTCLDGTWRLEQSCPPPRHAGPDATSSARPSGASPVPASCTPFTFDDRDVAEGCGPSMENPPDCPSQAAETCQESICLTGCTDFFMCTKHGWLDVGYCDDDAVFHDIQQ